MNSCYFYFSRRDYQTFIIAILLIGSGLICMYLDPEDYGFGALTLTIAPLLLLPGTILMAIGILGWDNIINRQYNFLSFSSFKKTSIASWMPMVVFVLSFFIYLRTLEPTASLWDCSEFIACAYKLQIPHTPGTPLFILIGHVFTMLALGDVEKVAWWMNFMSALASAGAVVFMYKMIWLLGSRLITKEREETTNKSNFPLLIAAASGSLTMAFCDTFWFSAVEAETYALASFFILLLLYLGLKWFYENEVLLSKRFLLFIFFLISLSYSIHPMCLLTLPAIMLLWYLKNRKVNTYNILIGTVLGFIVLLIINRVVATGIFEASFYLDKVLVDGVGLPFYSGVILFVLIVAASVIFLRKRWPKYNHVYWLVPFLIIGFWPYIMLSIRSAKNPPIDEGNPEDLAALTAYIKRESYGSRPLLYGQYFDAQIVDTEVSGKAYYKTDEGYEVAGKKIRYVYNDNRETILPRLYSSDKNHIDNYRSWTSLKAGQQPEFWHNIEFLFRYQLGHMWFRYLMWNFAGRKSDIQHAGWLTPVDSLKKQPPDLQNNKANNQYWMVPFLLGIVGFVFQYKHDKKGFLFSLMFFLTMGVILSLYLNSPPQEPRERDYIYVGSIIAYCIWVGVGILGINAMLSKYSIPSKIKPAILLIIAAFATGILLWENYDDHNRGHRTLQVEHARNILNSCSPNAILFTGGDNDTFPLWYLQEVEGVRTDVRVVVLSYFNSDWYINQNRQRHYMSEPLPISFDPESYRQYGVNDVIYINDGNNKNMVINAKKMVKLIKEDHPALRVQTRSGNYYHQIPSGLISLPFNSSAIHNVNLSAYQDATPTENLLLKVKGNYLEKNALILLDILLTNQWKRPIYFNYTSLNSIGFEVSPYVVQEGLLFRLLPIKNPGEDIVIDRTLMYNNLVKNANYTNFDDENIYLNYEDYYLRIILPVRQSFVMLAADFLEHGNKSKASEVANFAYGSFYPSHLPLSPVANNLSNILMVVGDNEKAKLLTERFYEQEYSTLTYALNKQNGKTISQQTLSNIDRSAKILSHLGEEHYYARWTDIMDRLKKNGI